MPASSHYPPPPAREDPIPTGNRPPITVSDLSGKQKLGLIGVAAGTLVVGFSLGWVASSLIKPQNSGGVHGRAIPELLERALGDLDLDQ